MELKKYQRKVIDDLNVFLEKIYSGMEIDKAYKNFWEEQNVPVGLGGIPRYNNQIEGVPHVCVKIPTGGGKTFVATSSLKYIFNNMPMDKKKVVVWLVPSDAILEQTLNTLKNPFHPYRQKLDRDFGSRVEIYSKNELLEGQNFNVSSVNEQLSVLVLSFDTFRSRRKEDRKVYQENSNLHQFTTFYENHDTLIQDIDETALIQVINQLSPVVIVDESHNATSELSVEMIKNLNPSFILDLTATPRENSNVIAFVDASQLKKESMVKLPVIAYNRPDQQEVIVDAIDLRNKLEAKALEEEKKNNAILAGSGKYIRPIVLFQAQPRNVNDATTFEKLKDRLIKAGIPKEHIAIKTADINEIKNIDLMSRDCEIRYIITVNALKEGWDCPFAYILATLANKTSKVDVEQILGRVLRQPYASKNENVFLNMSYVITSSNDFKETLENIIKGLNTAGFTKNDVRVAELEIDYREEVKPEVIEVGDLLTEEEQILDFSPEKIQEEVEKRNKDNTLKSSDENLGNMLSFAEKQNTNFETEISEVEEKGVLFLGELRDKMNLYRMNSQFEDEARKLSVPQFVIEAGANIFGDSEVLLTRERLTMGFTLADKALPNNLTATTEDLYMFDVSGDESGSVAKYSRMSKTNIQIFKEYLSSVPSSSRVNICKTILKDQLSRINHISDGSLHDYIDRIVSNMSTDELVALENNIYLISDKIKRFIDDLIFEHRKNTFYDLLEKGIISSKNTYELPIEINPLGATSFISKSLYESEAGDLNTTEHAVITQIASLDNVLWWHRIMERGKDSFVINGFVNHYPDFMLMTKKGRIILIEVKGEQLANKESRDKVELGRKWMDKSGDKYRYYMVFLNKEFDQEGAYNLDSLTELIRNL